MKPVDRKGRRGNSLVEFALSSSLLIVSFSAAFQFGFAFYRYNVLESAVSAGARYASLRTYRRLAGASDIEKVKAAVRNMVVYGTPAPDGTATPVIPGLAANAVQVTYSESATGVPMSVTVRISTLAIDAVFKQFTLTGKPVATFPFLGRYAPQESEP